MGRRRGTRLARHAWLYKPPTQSVRRLISKDIATCVEMYKSVLGLYATAATTTTTLRFGVTTGQSKVWSET